MTSTVDPSTPADSAAYNAATDPGAEVLDHDGAGRVSDLLAAARSFTAGASSTAAVLSTWGDYAWATWLPQVLRGAGVHVVLEPGWEHNGRPRSVGPFLPSGVMWHHDASPKGPTPGEADFIAHTGRPAEGIPAPLAQLWVCVGCDGAHPVGTWHVLAAGRANHAGEGKWGHVPRDAGNTRLIGVEVDHTAGEDWPAELVGSLQRGTAGILTHLGTRPGEWLCGHKEYAPDRKTDPDRLDMAKQRAAVALVMLHDHHPGADEFEPDDLAPFPGPEAFRLGHTSPATLQLERWLKAAGHFPYSVGPGYGPRTLAAVREFQRSHPRLRDDADGMPGPLTWKLVQVAARRAEGTK